MSSARPMTAPRLIVGLSELAPAYDALICDVWGVIHDGHKAHPAAAEALIRFRKTRGPVVLLTNAPRLTSEVAAQCAAYGVPADCYDAIVSSGGAAHDELARRAAGASAQAGATKEKATLPLYYIGPPKDLALMDGLAITRTGIAEAALALCTGLQDDLTETPEDYADRLAVMRARNLTMICANPDLVVHRGAQLCPCAGALAKDYEKLGGTVIYYGKPHRPIYDAALAAAGIAATAANRPTPKKPLAIGDGLFTDILGANRAGLDVLFIADGVHGKEIEPYSAPHLEKLFAKAGVTALAASRSLIW
jgi:HAD superfamily hydrolase (TIGR01459 family)